MTDQLLSNILRMGFIGCAVFTVFVIFMAFSGIASEMRDEEGNFRKKRNVKSILGGLLFILFLLGLLILGNHQLFKAPEANPNFLILFVNAFGIFFFIHLFDLVVLDYLIVVKWHPKFLKLPDTEYYSTFQPHLKGFLKGIPLGIFASLIATILSIIFF